MAVLAVLAVGLVVTLDVAHRVDDREAVVRGHVVDRGPGTASVPVEEIARSRQARGEVGTLAGVAAPVAAYAIAKAVVPFGEARRVLAELVTTRPDIPGFGDQLDLRQ